MRLERCQKHSDTSDTSGKSETNIDSDTGNTRHISDNNIYNEAYFWDLLSYISCIGKKITCGNIDVKCKVRKVASHEHQLSIAINGEKMEREIWKGCRLQTSYQTQTR